MVGLRAKDDDLFKVDGPSPFTYDQTQSPSRYSSMGRIPIDIILNFETN
jgi:hypothetical protein